MLICITGIDGCGKSTHVGLLVDALEKEGFNVFVSKAYGEEEKEKLSKLFEIWDSITITFVFQGLYRQQFVEAKKALLQGKIVIADRWDDPYLAYHSQFGFLSQDQELRERLNQIVFEGVIPDLTFFLNVPLYEAELRIQKRGKDFFDDQGREYHHKMAEAYLRIAEMRKWIVVNADQEMKIVHDQILKITKEKLETQTGFFK
ncbi:MAG: dTMP kinase [Candidatus Shapirobacteria bacterium]|nr:dTMP kinase [Candidatus Shapirobacteria bacterium]